MKGRVILGHRDLGQRGFKGIVIKNLDNYRNKNK
jgi:hypothetical protein